MIVKTKYATYEYKPGVGGGINQHMGEERRWLKQQRNRINQAQKAQINRENRFKKK